MRFAVYLATCATLFAANQAADIESITEVPVDLQVETESAAYLQLSAEAMAEADAYIQA